MIPPMNSPFAVTILDGGNLWDDSESRALGRTARICREEVEIGRTAAWPLAKRGPSFLETNGGCGDAPSSALVYLMT